MKTPALTADDIAELVAFLPRLHATDTSSVVSDGMNKEAGPTSLPAPDCADVFREFFDTASKPCWIDYRYTDNDVRGILAQAGGLAKLGIDEIKSVVTFLVQGERFLAGHREAMIEAGHVRRVLERLAELGAETPEGFAALQEKAAETSPWPDEVQRQTRAAIEQLSISQDRSLHVKHKVLGDAAIFAFDDSLLVIRVRDGRRWEYPDVEALLTDGWVID